MTARVPPEPICPRCGYSLVGLGVGACPECGEWVDPLNPGLPHGAAIWQTLAIFGPHRVVNGLYAVLVVGLFLLLCSPTGQVSDAWAFVVTLVTAGSVVVWTPLFAMHLLGRVGVRLKRVRQPRWRWGWVVVPAVLVGSIVVQQSGWVWQARWWASRQEFAALATQGAGVPARPGRLGAFYVVEAVPRSDGTIWCTLSFPDVYSQWRVELVYSPGRAPGGQPVVEDVGGGWWILMNPT